MRSQPIMSSKDVEPKKRYLSDTPTSTIIDEDIYICICEKISPRGNNLLSQYLHRPKNTRPMCVFALYIFQILHLFYTELHIHI